MLIPRIIERKRDGGALAPAEWAEVVREYTAGAIPDYQMAALLMAVWFRGMTGSECAALAGAMLASGGVLPRGEGGPPRVGKHSTGGVGDKVSLILAPLVAACGVEVPMIMGRGLGHTGGTLDKLEAIPGFSTARTLTDAGVQLSRVGCVLMGQSAEVAPADGRMYALRDTTGTVESIPLIAASIMSKKLAERCDALVLDVKYGAGAFMESMESGAELARVMLGLAAEAGVRAVALQTGMQVPLGRAVGNALEVEEALQLLRGESEAPADLREVTLALAREMLVLAGVVADGSEGEERAERALADGSALSKFAAVIEAQGGDARVVDDPGILPQAAECEVFRVRRKGYVREVNPRVIGRGLVEMRGGRSRMGDAIDPSVGFVLGVRYGEWVEAGDAVASVYAADEAGVQAGVRALAEGIVVGDAPPPAPGPLVAGRVKL